MNVKTTETALSDGVPEFESRLQRLLFGFCSPSELPELPVKRGTSP